MIELSIVQLVQFFYASDQFDTSPKLRISLVFSQIIFKFVYIYIYIYIYDTYCFSSIFDVV
jgi:hypothetical protein